MSTDNTVDGVEIKSSDHEQEFSTPRVCGLYQLNLETKWVDYLQKKLDYFNHNFFKNFQLHLVMEENKEEFDR